jgi:hypothetical protein
MKTCRILLATFMLAALPLRVINAQTVFGANFGGLPDMDNDIPISPTNIYSSKAGYGFEPGATLIQEDQRAICSTNPFYFSVKLPEGNYKVTVFFGGKAMESTTTVKAELRRLMLEKIHSGPEVLANRAFIVNLRLG